MITRQWVQFYGVDIVTLTFIRLNEEILNWNIRLCFNAKNNFTVVENSENDLHTELNLYILFTTMSSDDETFHNFILPTNKEYIQSNLYVNHSLPVLDRRILFIETIQKWHRVNACQRCNVDTMELHPLSGNYEQLSLVYTTSLSNS